MLGPTVRKGSNLLSAGIYGHRPLDGVTIKDGPDYPNIDTRLILDGQQRLTSCCRAFFGGLNVEHFPGRYYLNYPKYLSNPDLTNSEVEELVQFIRERRGQDTFFRYRQNPPARAVLQPPG
jgi:hypothetical protein